MKKLILALAILTVSLSGCMEKEKLPSSANITTMMSQSAENLSAYSFKLTDSQTESIKDLAKNNITKEYNTTIRSVQTVVAASIDLASRKAMADISATNTIKGPTGSPSILKSNGTEYNIGNTTYTSRDHGNWTQLKDPMPADALWAQGRYNLIKSRADAIKNQSEVEVIGSESIDGKDCYKLRIIADNQTYFGTLYNMLASVLFPFVPEINQTDLAKASKIETLMWVEKDSKLLKKYQHTLSITIEPNIMGAFNMSTGGIQKFNQSMKLVEVSLNTESTESYYDFNKPHDIVVPKAALSTTPIVPSPLRAGTISG